MSALFDAAFLATQCLAAAIAGLVYLNEWLEARRHDARRSEPWSPNMDGGAR